MKAQKIYNSNINFLTIFQVAFNFNSYSMHEFWTEKKHLNKNFWNFFFFFCQNHEMARNSRIWCLKQNHEIEGVTNYEITKYGHPLYNHFSRKEYQLASKASNRKHDILLIFFKNIFSKHQNRAEFKNLDESEVLISYFSGLITSAASLTSSASTTSLASAASKALFHQKTCWWCFCNVYPVALDRIRR